MPLPVGPVKARADYPSNKLCHFSPGLAPGYRVVRAGPGMGSGDAVGPENGVHGRARGFVSIVDEDLAVSPKPSWHRSAVDANPRGPFERFFTDVPVACVIKAFEFQAKCGPKYLVG